MESKNIKVIDEHGIDREANIICGFIVDGTKYVLYSIERDEESDNLFVSKVRDNFDKTSSMENIEVGKDKVNDVVKELVTYSIKNENDKTSGNVLLPNGESVEITNVLFNKEQNIVVPKTYVSTVKKSVTKVSKEFYKVDKQNDDLEKTTIFETLSNEEIVKEPEMVMPEINATEEEVLSPEPAKEETIALAEPTITPSIPAVEESTEIKESEIKPISVVEPAIEQVAPIPMEEPKPEMPVPSFVVPPVDQVAEVKPQPELEVPGTLLESSIPPVVATTPTEPEINKNMEVTPEPVIPSAPVIPTPVASTSPVKEEMPAVDGPKLIFDGANENNLNKALDEVSEEKVVSAPQEGVESLREFGVDKPPVTPAVAQVEEAPTVDDVKKLTRSKGFANNKFFMIIAIAFFLAACAFLGYEAFQYFTLK